jgi:cyanate permease
VGEFSIWHWIIVLFMFANLAMIVHIAVSPRTHGWKKALFVIAALLIPLLPYLVWLIARNSATEASSSARVKEAEARALQAEAEAREAEARARIARAGSAPPQ